MTDRTQIILTGETERQAAALLAETWAPHPPGRIVLCQLRRAFRGEVRTVLDCVVLSPEQAGRLRRAISHPGDGSNNKKGKAT